VIDVPSRAHPVFRELPRAVLVDLDDTIVDGTAVVDCWRAACECCPPEAPSGAILAEILRLREWYWSDPIRHRQGRLNMSAARRHIVAAALVNVGCDATGLADRIAERYDQCRDDRTSLFPGAVRALTWLRQSGCRLALVTNGAAAMQRQKIARFQLEPLFDAIFVEGELGFGKPDERIYQLALTALAAVPGDSWMIGDNLEWDVEQPQKLGITGIWVNATEADVPVSCAVRPCLVIRRLADLPDYCARSVSGCG
jgi:putative hydrolase of the HAD superfamily